MIFNCNSTVKVKLTPRGREILDEQDNDLILRQPKLKEFIKRIGFSEDKEGYSTWQLWVLMNRFGGYMNMGDDMPFEPDIVIPIEHLRENIGE